MTTRTANGYTFNSSNTIHNVQRVLAALVTPHSYKQLAEALHMSTTGARTYLKYLHGQRQIRIAKYEQAGSRQVAFYVVGSRPDAKCPPAMTRAQINAKHRAKVNASEEAVARRRTRDNLRHMLNTRRAKPATWAAPVMGRAA